MSSSSTQHKNKRETDEVIEGILCGDPWHHPISPSAHSGTLPGQYRLTFVWPILPLSLSLMAITVSLTPAVTDIVLEH